MRIVETVKNQCNESQLAQKREEYMGKQVYGWSGRLTHNLKDKVIWRWHAVCQDIPEVLYVWPIFLKNVI